MARNILFTIRDPTELEMVLEDLAVKRETGTYGSNILVIIGGQTAISTVARMTIGAMNTATVGGTDPYKLCEISNT